MLTFNFIDSNMISIYSKSIILQALLASIIFEYALSVNCAFLMDTRRESSIYFSAIFVYRVGHIINEVKMTSFLSKRLNWKMVKLKVLNCL